jgi:mono/diheme cytochrome c family protein
LKIKLNELFSTVLKQATKILSIVCCSLFLTNAFAAEPRKPEKVFEDTCAYCHGHYIAPGLQVVRDVRGRSLPPELTKTFVRNGLGAMPAFRQTEISDEELAILAEWLKNSKAPTPPGAPHGQ